VSTHQVSITALILAGGASSRMGSPKALLRYKGQTFLDRLISSSKTACDEVVAVLGRHADEIRAGICGQAKFVINPDPSRGQLSSLQCGLDVISSDAMFIPVDLPAVEAATIRKLVEAFQSGNSPLAVPTNEGKHGHPVSTARPIIEELLALPPTGQARDVIHRHRAETLYVAVDDPGVLRDIDTKSEYQDLLVELTGR